MDKKLLLNISGHPLSDLANSQAKERGYKIITCPVPNVDLAEPSSIQNYIKTVFDTLTKNKNIVRAIKTGNYIVIPPGLSILTSGITAMLHGLGGAFPNQLILVRNNEGIYELGDVFDLQKMRLDYRDFRNP
ncbi:MAG: CRISPR-associated protein Csx15 [Promethearchaeota archaeon]